MREALDAPINVYASPAAPSIAELERAGIARLSLGPALLKATFATMQTIARSLKNGTYVPPAQAADPTPLVVTTPEASD